MQNTHVLAAGEAMPAVHNPVPTLYPDDLSGRYSLIADGDCMLPQIDDGEKMVFNPDAVPEPGDIVALFWRPDLVKPGEHQVIVKRLVVGPAPWAIWGKPTRGDVNATIIVEMLNPRQQFVIPCGMLLGMHKYEGPVFSRDAGRLS